MKNLLYKIVPHTGPSFIKDGPSTLTVGELTDVLKRFPPSMPVLAEWEGIYTTFRDDSDHVDVEDWEGKEWEFMREEALILNVDEH